MHPAQYWRNSKCWKAWIGKTGTIIVSTRLHVASPKQVPFLPYSFALVDFDGKKAEFMGADHQEFQPGDLVTCVLRKIEVSDASDIIVYGVKIQKID